MCRCAVRDRRLWRDTTFPLSLTYSGMLLDSRQVFIRYRNRDVAHGGELYRTINERALQERWAMCLCLIGNYKPGDREAVTDDADSSDEVPRVRYRSYESGLPYE